MIFCGKMGRGESSERLRVSGSDCSMAEKSELKLSVKIRGFQPRSFIIHLSFETLTLKRT